MKRIDKPKILQELARLYPDAKPALVFTTAYELLVAVILSAQCTDERVNIVTAKLFEKYSTPQAMVTLSQEELEKYIFSCGFYRMKASHILSASKDILEKFDGKVPDTVEKLTTLAGVGKNHMHGDISACFYKGIAGINVDESYPGFKNTIFKPQFVSTLEYAEAEHMTPYGIVASSWKRQGDKINLELTVPINCTGELILPDAWCVETMSISKITMNAGNHEFVLCGLNMLK